MKNSVYSDIGREASKRYSGLKRRKAGIKWERHDFIRWYIETPKKCNYCDLSENELLKFYHKNNSKRKTTRGRSLEIDRLEDKPYSQKNCVFACYWCNNAKSDVFTSEEFKPIGKAIGKAIQTKIK